MIPEIPMRYEVTFLGGPLGGTTQMMPSYQPTIRVPVYAGRSYYIEDLVRGYSTEEYVAEPGTRRQVWCDLTTVTYRWRNPNQALIAENVRLRADVKKNEEIASAFATLKKHLR